VNLPVFLDSGIFIALMSRKDRWHEQAVALFGGPTPRWSTSILVVSETYTWFLHRMGEEQARTFRQLIGNLKGLRILDATQEHHAAVARMLDKFRGAKLSFVDASSLVHLEQRKIRRVWSTDHHLGVGGAEILPRS
jgi:predicted nucleic acid-binding protein